MVCSAMIRLEKLLLVDGRVMVGRISSDFEGLRVDLRQKGRGEVCQVVGSFKFVDVVDGCGLCCSGDKAMSWQGRTVVAMKAVGYERMEWLLSRQFWLVGLV